MSEIEKKCYSSAILNVTFMKFVMCYPFVALGTFHFVFYYTALQS